MSVKIKRTGNIYSFAATEYLATFPDGSTETLWSPPWHEWGDDEEDRRAWAEAERIWENRTCKDHLQVG